MKKILWVMILVLSWAGPVFAQSAERILSFHSDIDVQMDGSMTVTETIRVMSRGHSIKHGIYRDFPTHYRGSTGQNIVVDFNILSVDRDGQSEEYRSEPQLNGVRIYFGNKNIYVPTGEHTYVLTYVTDRQLGYFKDHDELYWNVTGNGWEFAIDEASASVELPREARDRISEINAFTGSQGAVGKDFESGRSIDGRVTFQTTRPLQSREGLTILVAWPKGCIFEPTLSKNIGYFLKDNRGILVGGVGLLILFLFFLFTWDQVGRDPAKGVIIPLFYPPSGVSPAFLRYLMRMGFDHKAVACAVISMAVKGYLTIREAEDGVAILTRTGQTEDKLTPEERVVAREFFTGSRTSIELVRRNHAVIASGIDRLKNALARNIEKIYFVTNKNYFIIGVVISFAVILATAVMGARRLDLVLFLSVWLSIWTVAVTAMIFAVIMQWRGVLKGSRELFGTLFLTVFSLPFVVAEVFVIGIFIGASSVGVVAVLLATVGMDVVFYYLLKAPTLQGRRLMDQVEGFKMYLSVAEKDRLQMLGGPQDSTELFEQYLPYALALDVEQAWAERFSDMLARSSQDGRTYQPAWYSGTLWSAAGCAGFASGLGSSLANTISSSSTAPGSSSGGGGGGSSGGGGGGGGGGGW